MDSMYPSHKCGILTFKSSILHGHVAHENDLCEDQVVPRNIVDADVPHWTLLQIEQYQAHIQDLQQRICVLRALYNTTPPIHRLPTELLMQVFTHIVSPGTRYSLYVAHVCRRWRSAVLRMPHFWADILASVEFDGCIVMENEFLHAALGWSAALPLRLRVRKPESLTWDILTGHRQRLSRLSLCISSREQLDALQETINAGFSGLHELDITCQDDPVGYAGLALCVKTLPRLRHLQLPAHLFTPDTITSLLESVKIHGRTRGRAALASALEACASLRSVSIAHTKLTEWPGRWVGFPLRSVRLPRLSELVLEDYADVMWEVLNALVLPESCLTHLIFLPDAGDTFENALPPAFSGLYVPPYIHHLAIFVDLPDRSPKAWCSSELETSHFAINAKGYVQGREHLRMTYYVRSESQLLGFVEPFRKSSVSELAIVITASESTEHGDTVHTRAGLPRTTCCAETLASLLDASPCLCRLEMLVPTAGSAKRAFVEAFLRLWGFSRAESRSADGQTKSIPTLVWELDGDGGYASGLEAAREMEDLVEVLNAHKQAGGRKLESLELRMAKGRTFEPAPPNNSYIPGWYDAVIFRYLPRLQELAVAVAVVI